MANPDLTAIKAKLREDNERIMAAWRHENEQYRRTVQRLEAQVKKLEQQLLCIGAAFHG